MTDEEIYTFEKQVLGHELALRSRQRAQQRAMVLGGDAATPEKPKPSFFARMEAVPTSTWVAIGGSAVAIVLSAIALACCKKKKRS